MGVTGLGDSLLCVGGFNGQTSIDTVQRWGEAFWAGFLSAKVYSYVFFQLKSAVGKNEFFLFSIFFLKVFFQPKSAIGKIMKTTMN